MRTVTALCLGTASAFMATSAHKPKLAARRATETLPEGEFEYRVAILGDLHVRSSALISLFITESDAPTRESVSERPKETAPPRATETPPRDAYPRRSTRATSTTPWKGGST